MKKYIIFIYTVLHEQRSVGVRKSGNIRSTKIFVHDFFFKVNLNLSMFEIKLYNLAYVFTKKNQKKI